jgi:hypothetical protein
MLNVAVQRKFSENFTDNHAKNTLLSVNNASDNLISSLGLQDYASCRSSHTVHGKLKRMEWANHMHFLSQLQLHVT